MGLLLLLLTTNVRVTAADDHEDLIKDLFQSVRNDDPDLIKQQLDKGADINFQGPGGQTPLMHAVLQGRYKAVKFLLEAGADTSIGEKDGFTPLHGAGFQGRAKIAKDLIDAGLDPMEFHARDGYLPMHRACWGREKRHAQTVKVFLQEGMSPTQPAKNGKTPMEMAANNPLTKRYLQDYINLENKLSDRLDFDGSSRGSASGDAAKHDVNDEL
eukprot:CAMPEP_0119547742 /NCGR_PEP_ID=MMETSP1352-20130426/1799_1 /TAXON_ID=265584 /ORGANISM="Stauroneis constricta, Strain CCMP1120" /LENGTH=213 /DNA_ID=CAMNT_0007592759 /DNA_START=98 /DNA_END=739 /DNA_ORIENTATION=+